MGRGTIYAPFLSFSLIYALIATVLFTHESFVCVLQRVERGITLFAEVAGEQPVVMRPETAGPRAHRYTIEPDELLTVRPCLLLFVVIGVQQEGVFCCVNAICAHSVSDVQELAAFRAARPEDNKKLGDCAFDRHDLFHCIPCLTNSSPCVPSACTVKHGRR